MPELHDITNTIVSGAPLAGAKAALILVHGRGATAESILELAAAFGRIDIAYIAPQATANTWYPYPFMAPIAANEPWLGSALTLLHDLIGRLGAEGHPPERIGLLGFSQGACLSSEFLAQNARRYGCAAILTGGLIGPPETPRNYAGSLGGTPVLIGSSDIDPHIPLARVEETASVLKRLGAAVDMRIYPGMGHTVNADELEAVKALLAQLVSSPDAAERNPG